VWRDIAIVGNVFARAVAQISNISHGWLGEIVRVNAEMERLNFQMRAMSTADDPIKDAAESVAWLRREATQAPFSLKAITNSFVKLKAARLDPQGGTLRSFLDGLAAFGAGDEQLHRVSIAITQMAGKSVIQMEELRQQLGEHMPTAMRLMARSMGMTVGELTKVVSTGTLEASDALKKLSKEMDRVYGGAAIRMMQTFSGQMTQMKANIQLLMTDEGGKAFFNSIKEQLLDLNDFLSSGQAKYYAKQLGEGLASITLTVKDTIAWFWKWRDVIVAVGTTIAGAYGISKFAGMIQSLSTALVGSVTNLKNSLQGAAYGITSLGAGLNGLRTGQHTITSLGIAAMGLRTTLAGITASIPLIGIGLLGLQVIIGLFGDWESAAEKAAKATEEAYKRTKEGGAKSYDEAAEAIKNQIDLLNQRINIAKEDEQKYLKNLQQLDQQDKWSDEYAEKARAANMPYYGQDQSRYQVSNYGIGLGGIDTTPQRYFLQQQINASRKIAEASQKELNQEQPLHADILREYDERDRAEGRRVAERQIALSKEAEAVQRNYTDRMNLLDTQREEEIKAEMDKGGRVQAVINKHNNTIIAEQKKLYTAKIRIAKDERKEIEKMQAADAAREKRKEKRDYSEQYYAGRLAAYDDYVAQLQKDHDNLHVDKLIANTFIAAVDSNNKKLEDGAKAVTKMQKALGETKAEALGMGNAYAKMVAQIQNGTFGSLEGLFGQELEAAKKLHQTLLDIAADTAFADKQKEGYLKYINDIQQMQRKNQNDKIQNEIDAEELRRGIKLTQSEIIEIKRKNGDYFGISDDEEVIRKQFKEFAESMNKQGLLAQQLGDVFRNNAFGEATEQHIQKTADEVNKVNDALKETARTLSGLSFDGFSNITKDLSLGLTSISAGLDTAITNNATPALNNLPKNVEGRMAQAMQYLMGKDWSQNAAAGIVGNLYAESRLDPTRSGDNGTSVGIAQWHNERMVAMKQWITAQGKDWRDLYAQLDFLDHELRTSERLAGNQLRLAGSPIQAARTFMDKFERPAEWAKKQSWGDRAGAAQRADTIVGEANGGRGYQISNSMKSSMPDSVTIPIHFGMDKKTLDEAIKGSKTIISETTDDLAKGHTDEMSNRLAHVRNLTEAERREIEQKTLALFDANLKMTEKEQQLRKMFKDAGLNDDEIDKEIEAFRLAQERYDVGKKYAAVMENFDKKRLETAVKITELGKQAANPNYKGMSDEMQRLNQQIDEILPKIKEIWGADSDQYKAAYEGFSAMLSQQATLELSQLRANTAKETQTYQQSLMTKSQLRKANMEQALRDEDVRLQYLIANGADEVAATERTARAKALIKQKYNEATNPVAGQMREWIDIQSQLEKSVTGWMDSLADGMAGLITGAGDLRSAIQGIINDIAKMATKWLLSGLFGGSGVGGTKLGRGGGFPAAPMPRMTGLYHTGGIAGDGAMLRSMSALTWMGAPRFHSGGLVGGLLPSEVPIIAKKGEGIFTPEQMKSMGGFQQNQCVNPAAIKNWGHW